MRDRGCRQDAVAEVKDQRASAEMFHDVINLAVKCRTASQERQWIDIALHWHPRLKRIAGDLSLKGPVNTDRADACHLHIR